MLNKSLCWALLSTSRHVSLQFTHNSAQWLLSNAAFANVPKLKIQCGFHGNGGFNL